jgi:hypothetical protein
LYGSEGAVADEDAAGGEVTELEEDEVVPEEEPVPGDEDVPEEELDDEELVLFPAYRFIAATRSWSAFFIMSAMKRNSFSSMVSFLSSRKESSRELTVTPIRPFASVPTGPELPGASAGSPSAAAGSELSVAAAVSDGAGGTSGVSGAGAGGA